MITDEYELVPSSTESKERLFSTMREQGHFSDSWQAQAAEYLSGELCEEITGEHYTKAVMPLILAKQAQALYQHLQERFPGKIALLFQAVPSLGKMIGVSKVEAVRQSTTALMLASVGAAAGASAVAEDEWEMVAPPSPESQVGSQVPRKNSDADGCCAIAAMGGNGGVVHSHDAPLNGGEASPPCAQFAAMPGFIGR